MINNVYINVAPALDAMPLQTPLVYPDLQFSAAPVYQPQVFDHVPQQFFVPNPIYLPTPKPKLTQTVHQKTLELLSKANEQVTLILDRKASTANYAPYVAPPKAIPAVASAPAINIDLSDKSWKMFNNETQVHHHYHQGEDGDKQKDQTGLRILVGIVGLAAALAAAFFAGKAIAGQEDAQEETLSFDELKTQWNTNKTFYNATYQANVDKIIGRMESIYKRNATNRAHKIALLVFAFIAGGTAFGGAIAASNLLMGAGAVIGAATAAAAMYKLGYSYFSKGAEKDAEAIEIAINDLQSQPIKVYP